MKAFLRLSSLFALSLMAGCSAPYKSLQPAGVSGPMGKEHFSKELFRCNINGRFLIKRYHLSGLLLCKRFGADTDTRVMFQNEMGYPFFDFSWNAKDSFSVVGIDKRLNRQALVRTLQNDIEMLLRMKLDETKVANFRNKSDSEYWKRYPRNGGFVFYVYKNGQYRQIDYGRKRSVTTIIFPLPTAGLPDDIHIAHHKAHFTIDLKKITSPDE